MRIATWNINSVRTRIERAVDFLQRHDVDVLALQETKVKDEAFPTDPFTEAGYEVAHYGLNQWNGVALISRVGIADVRTHFPQQPGYHNDPAQPQDVEARAIGASCGGVEVWSLYVPNGREIAHPHYDYKLRFLYTLGAYAHSLDTPAVFVGDYNIAPRDSDVWDPSFFAGKTHLTEPERHAFEFLCSEGVEETSRRFSEGDYSYWDYTAMRFPKNEGMRIDFQVATAALVARARSGFVDREERAGKGASDHVPVVVDYD
ncbi:MULTISPECIES: exodeoxyribonuclease III [Corynebacterium]|uniref:exodeoxyribonuclease III n=1 Tax=Corynebacterium TaxID=1716 RepID=UPI00124DDCD3|nr:MULTISPECIES: exodeoxyribonuclease III [Corynebacterium]